MGRQPCCDKVGLKKGPWTADEDKKLVAFILANGQCCWRAVPKLAGLLRCGKSCRLRWTNYLRPDVKRGLLSEHEEKTVINLHAQLGNRWSKIASQLPGRTDNEIKNHWNTHIKKRLRKMGIDPLTHKPLSPEEQANPNPKTDDPPPLTESTVVDSANDFCVNEIPVVEPHEILLPGGDEMNPSSSTASSSCSSFDELVFTEDMYGEMMDSDIWKDDFDALDWLLNEGGVGDSWIHF